MEGGGDVPIFHEQLRWVESEGGPLLLLAAPYVRYWEGVDPPSAGRVVEARFRWRDPSAPATDYDRACDVDDWLGVLPVGPSEGLVLGGDPTPTAWRSDAPDAGTLVRWIVADSGADVAGHLARITQDIWTGSRTAFAVDDTPLYLFDAALPGDELVALGDQERLTIHLAPGRYVVRTGEYRADDGTE